MSPIANPNWLAIAAEAGIAASQIGEGATLLGKVTPERTWSFSRVFFALSIGIERACKLALQVDATLTTGSYLDEAQMRKHGHRLNGLLDSVEAMAKRRGVTASRPDDSVHVAIVDILTGFATNGRYHHLDFLAGAQSGSEPAKQWWERVIAPVANRHYRADKRAADEQMADKLGSELDRFTVTSFSHVAGHEITSMRQGLVDTALLRAALPWTRVYVLQIARWLAQVMRHLNHACYEGGRDDIPDLRDFFWHFDVDESYMRTRSTWRPD